MKDEQSVEDQVNNALDDSIENLSPDVRRRLNQIRILATEPKSKPSPLWGLSPMWKLASGVSFLLVISLSWQFMGGQKEELIMPFAAVLEEDLEMLDDLEFVYWLAEESDSAML